MAIGYMHTPVVVMSRFCDNNFVIIYITSYPTFSIHFMGILDRVRATKIGTGAAYTSYDCISTQPKASPAVPLRPSMAAAGRIADAHPTPPSSLERFSALGHCDL